MSNTRLSAKRKADRIAALDKAGNRGPYPIEILRQYYLYCKDKGPRFFNPVHLTCTIFQFIEKYGLRLSKKQVRDQWQKLIREGRLPRHKTKSRWLMGSYDEEIIIKSIEEKQK